MKEEKELKREKRKQTIANVKEFMSNKRNRALVKLIIYAIFFTFVIIFIRVTTARNRKYLESHPNEEQTESLPDTITDNLKKLNQIEDYEFSINYLIQSDTDTKYNITGINQGGLLQINIDDKVYSYDGQKFYELIDKNKEFLNNIFINDINLFTPNKIYNYLLKSEYQYKKEDINKIVTINSNLKISDFALVNNNLVDNDDIIVIETTEKEENNILVSLNLTNYYKTMNPDITLCLIDIEFKY